MLAGCGSPSQTNGGKAEGPGGARPGAARSAAAPVRTSGSFSPARVRGSRSPPAVGTGRRRQDPHTGATSFSSQPRPSLTLLTRGISNVRLGLDGAGSKSGGVIFPSLKILPRSHKSQIEEVRARSRGAKEGEKRPFPPHTPTLSLLPESHSQVSPEVTAPGSGMGPEQHILPPEPKKKV